MSNTNHHKSSDVKPSKTNKTSNANANAIIKEMLPFALYAAIPILITISIAYFFGSTAQ